MKTLLLLLLPSIALAQKPLQPDEPWPIPPQHEQQILQWILPLAENTEVANAWFLRDINVERTAVKLGLAQGADAQRTWVTLVHEAPGRAGLLAGETRVQCPRDLPPPVCQKIVQVLEHPQHPGPWLQPIVPLPTQPFWLMGPRPFVLLAWLALLVLGVRALRRSWKIQPFTRREQLATLLVVAVAAVVRLEFAPRAFLHELYKSASATEFLLTGALSPYGEAIGAPALLLDTLLGTGEQGLFALNLVLSVLSVPAMLLLDFALFGRRPASWLTALAVALWPMHVRFAACEEVWTASLALLALSLTAWRWFLVHKRTDLLAITALTTALLVQLRPEWLFVPVFHVTLLLALEGPLGLIRLPWRRLLLFALPLIALLLWQVRAVGPGHALELPGAHIAQLWSPIDPQTTSAWMTALLCAGLVCSLFKRRRAYLALWLLAMHLTLTLLEFAFFSTMGPYAQRVQIVPMGLLLPLVGLAGDMLAHFLPQPLAFALPVLGLTTQFFLHLPQITWQSAQQAEWNFLQEAAPKLPRHFRLLTRAGEGHVAAFPQYVLKRSGKDVPQSAVLDTIERVERGDWPEPGPDLLVYEGMSCWLFGDELGNVALPRQACEQVRAHYVLTPLEIRDLPPVPYPPIRHHPPGKNGFQVGFYRAAAWRSSMEPPAKAP